MQPSHLAIPLGILLALGSAQTLAAPGYDHPHPAMRHHAPPPPAYHAGGKHHAAPAARPGKHVTIRPGPPPPPRSHPAHVRPFHPAQHARPAPHVPPPRDFRPVRVHIHANRHYIGRGPALPPHVRIVRGKPLPPGWGRKLSHQQHRYVPHYRGYEWRRAGSDLVLVALATGIVHEILHEVLR